jgi:hypothetical protein
MKATFESNSSSRALPRAVRRYAAAAVAAFACSGVLFGCGVAEAPIKTRPAVVASPLPGRVTVGVQKADSVGGVVPVYVSISNGTDIPRAVVPGQIFAINASGERVAPLPPGEAARLAGGAGELKAALESAAVSGVAGGAVGAGAGAAIGSVIGGGGGVGRGAIIGSAIGAAEGMFDGVGKGQARADREASQQIRALALHRENVRHDFTVSGYVFFPDGNYSEIDVLLVNRETGDTEVVRRPWP